MANTAPPYRRLSGTGYHYLVPPWALVLLFFVMGIFVLLFRGRRTQLWLGPEHLLLVETDGYREYYKRFNYRDIQAFIIRKTPQGKAVNVLLATIAALLIFFAIVVADPVVGGVLGGIGAFCGLLLLINALRGPTCHCRLHTAVQGVDLPSLTRVRLARNVLGKIRPPIEQVQGRAGFEPLVGPTAARPDPVRETPGPTAS